MIMVKRTKTWLATVLSLALSLATTSAWAVTMEGIEFSSLPGDRTEIRMVFDGPPPAPNGYTIEQPARIVLDLPGVVSALDEKHHTLGIGNARRVSVISTRDRTRAIVNLTELVSYDTDVQGNTLYLTVGAGSSLAGEPAPSQISAADDQRTVAGRGRIDSVDFRRGKGGEGRVILGLSNPKVPVNVSSDSGRIRVEVRNTTLPKDLQRRLDVTDFATPVHIVDALQEGDNVVFTIAAEGNYDYLPDKPDSRDRKSVV